MYVCICKQAKGGLYGADVEYERSSTREDINSREFSVYSGTWYQILGIRR